MLYIRGCDDITKRDVSGWRGNTGEKSVRKKMRLESLPESKKSGNGSKDDMVTYSMCSRQRMRTTWTLPLKFFREGIHIVQGRGRSQ